MCSYIWTLANQSPILSTLQFKCFGGSLNTHTDCFSPCMNAVQEEMRRNFQPVYNVRSNFMFHIPSAIFREDRNQASLNSVRQSMAGKWHLYQHAPLNTGSRVGCSTSEKSPLWALLTDAFQQGLNTCFYDARGLTLGSSSEQSHFPTSSTSSVFQRISKVEWCTAPLMSYIFTVFLKSHWFFQSVHYLPHVEKTVVSLFLPTCLLDGNDV